MNDLSLHIIDIIQNSLSAGAGRIIVTVDENLSEDLLTIIIEDNGKGMSGEIVRKLEDPFYTTRTTRKVGMGIPLYKQSALQSGIPILEGVYPSSSMYCSIRSAHVFSSQLNEGCEIILFSSSIASDVSFSNM